MGCRRFMLAALPYFPTCPSGDPRRLGSGESGQNARHGKIDRSLSSEDKWFLAVKHKFRTKIARKYATGLNIKARSLT